VPSQRRERRAEQVKASVKDRPRRPSPVGAYGERPPSWFAPVPVSEIAIFAGGVAIVLGLFVLQEPAAWIVGIIVCGLGVLEVTAREHFSGYKSHTWLLAGVPAVAAEIVIATTVGRPANRILLVLPVGVIFGVLFWFLRRRFQIARQRRLSRPPGA
jgi:hypothetical protein